MRGNSGRLTGVKHSSRKSSATHSYQCVQYFRVSKQWYERQYLEFLTCVQVLMHAIANGGCTDTVRGQSTLEVDPERNSRLTVYHKHRSQHFSSVFQSVESKPRKPRY